MTPLELTGRARTHVVQRDDLGVALHPAAAAAFEDLRSSAAREEFDIAIVSGFRDFEAQVRIWNLKFRGERLLYSRDGTELDHTRLAPGELIEAILCWSALPGASRHHWGSELDVIDRAAVPADYRVRLLPEETREGGVFFRLHQWLDRNLASFGFFRPYRSERGGVAVEPWHLSYAPVSCAAQRELTLEMIAEAVRNGGLLGADYVLQRLPDIYARYVANVDPPPAPLASAA